MTDYVVGIDLGGTKVEACLLDTQKNCQARHRHPSGVDQGRDRVIENILSVVNRAASGRPFLAAGIGTPGTYSESRDRLYGSPHTLLYEKPGFIKTLRERLAVPLIVENDANCLALAEYFASCQEKYSHVLAVILGTGMGSGLILNGRLYRGAKGGAGELGHMTIDINGRKCQCGRTGCAEAYLSGPSLSRRFSELSGEEIELQEIYRRYESGHPLAVDLLEKSCRIMGEVFANAVNGLDIEAIILGGGVSQCTIWYEKVPAYLNQHLFGVPRGKIPVIQAKLGDSAGVIGAGYLALRHIGTMDF
jgi:predicted NBD/HSP70 family sugar kinase